MLLSNNYTFMAVKKTAISVIETAVLFIVFSCWFKSYHLIEIYICFFLCFSSLNRPILGSPKFESIKNGRISTKNELKKRVAKISQTLDFTEQFAMFTLILPQGKLRILHDFS